MSHQRDIDAAMLQDINQTPEDISNKAQGHKANLSNPNTSLESKEHSRQVLRSLGGEDAFYSKDEPQKDADRAATASKSK